MILVVIPVIPGNRDTDFHRKIFDIFLIFAQNIDCGYMLEPPRRTENRLAEAPTIYVL